MRRSCILCGTVVEHVEVQGVKVRMGGWVPVVHKAACGLPCRGGMANLETRLLVPVEGEAHDKTSCPLCSDEGGDDVDE